MSSTLLEYARLSHESAERYEISVNEYLESAPNGQKAKVWQQHYIKNAVGKVVDCNKDLLKVYEDNDLLLKDELNGMKGSEIFSSFYASLNATREYYEKFPAVSGQLNMKTELDVNVQFSGEEVFGKYLDLNPFHLQFNNVSKKSIPEQDYLQYLDRFNSFFYIPAGVKITSAYIDYLDKLWLYMYTFFEKVNPLISLKEIVEQWELDFDAKWTRGSDKAANPDGTKGEPLRLGMFGSPDELEALGGDRLKQSLEVLGLKCGGTLKDKALRLWSVRGKKAEDFPASARAKAPTKRKLTPAEDINGSYPWSNNVAWKESRILSLSEVMHSEISATRKHAEKQQSRSAEEKEAEIREEEFGLAPVATAGQEEGGEDGDDEPIYNPLNLPLGWDGKPIPFWLYKLHGLGVEYKCEVCGNQSYWGRRAFDRHFQEGKHAHGMRCLGVPNTKHFHDITLIEDVLTLYGKIRESLAGEQFEGAAEEEFEDSQGNVLDRRTYEDLARQGLL